MPSVGLEAFRGLVVPETNGAVVCCGEDVFGVRGELDVLTGQRVKSKNVLKTTRRDRELPDGVSTGLRQRL